jgi:hypothetical protein
MNIASHTVNTAKKFATIALTYHEASAIETPVNGPAISAHIRAGNIPEVTAGPADIVAVEVNSDGSASVVVVREVTTVTSTAHTGS